MTRHISSAGLLCCAALMGCCTITSEAQAEESAAVLAEAPTEAFVEVNAPPARRLDATRRRELYEVARLEPREAVGRSALLPGLGNIYSDRVFKGMCFMGVAGMSVGLIVGGIGRDERTFIIPGVIGLVGAYGGSMITSYFDVQRYNGDLRRRYKVSLGPGGGQLVLSF